jgi:hypothetical protein
MQNESDKTNDRQINITGTNNRYLIKRANRVKNEIKKREVMNKYNVAENFLTYDSQLQLIKEIYNKESCDINSREKDILNQEIERKLTSYKQQDVLKKKYNENAFVDIDSVIKKIIDNEMKCFYCSCQMLVLYEIC